MENRVATIASCLAIFNMLKINLMRKVQKLQAFSQRGVVLW